MKWLFYIIVYGFLGFWLERIINVVFIGWYDNSVLIGPVQPMYGIGVTVTIAAYALLKKTHFKHWVIVFFLCVIGILSTWASEMISGTLFEYFYDYLLWDYRDTFTFACYNPHSCIVPTGMFGLLSVFTVLVIHPYIDHLLMMIPKRVKWMIIALFIADVIWTYRGVVLP